MADFTIIQPSDLSAEFTVGTTGAGGDVTINYGNIVSADANNDLQAAVGDGKLFVNTATSETAWAGSSTGFLTVTPAGTNGHVPTFAIDFTDAAFVEGVQDAIGQAVLAGSGITYDDVSDSISSALGSLTFGNGLTTSGLTAVEVLPDPNSPSPVAVTAAGVSVTPGISADAGNLGKLGSDNKVMVDPADVATALATIDICDLARNVIAKGFAP